MEATITFLARVADELKVHLIEGKFILSKQYLQQNLGKQHNLKSLNAVLKSKNNVL